MRSLDNTPADLQSDIVIIGGGWAGLASAFLLNEKGYQVTLLEAAPYFGGRARGLKSTDSLIPTLDNGQHLLMGAYHSTLDLLNRLKLKESDYFNRKSFQVKSIGDIPYTLSLPKLKAPLHLLMSLFTSRFSPKVKMAEKLALLKIVPYLKDPQLLSQTCGDIVLVDFLHQIKQSPQMIKLFWKPLAVAALSTPICKASAQIFVNVLHRCFNFEEPDSHFLFANTDLSTLLVDPILNNLSQSKKFNARTNARVLSLSYDDTHYAVSTKENNYLAKHVIIATPWNGAQTLLSPFKSCQSICENLSQFEHEEITTVYLHYSKEKWNNDKNIYDKNTYDKNAILGFEMIHIQDQPFTWLFDRTQPEDKVITLVAVIPHKLQQPKAELIECIAHFIQANFGLSDLMESQVLSQKRAAFSCTPQMQACRPKSKTPQPNLWLVGDYIDTQYPATLEGAIKSAYLCSEQFSRKHKQEVKHATTSQRETV